MKKPSSLLRSPSEAQFNMTAMIDVVFLLIIFFMLICRFIGQENYELVIPDDCANAMAAEHSDRNAVTISVFARSSEVSRGVQADHSATGPSSPAGVVYAVRSVLYDLASPLYQNDPQQMFSDMSDEIVRQAARKNNRLVHLRAGKELTYGQVQEVLLALSQAGIKKVQLAAFRTKELTRQHANEN